MTAEAGTQTAGQEAPPAARPTRAARWRRRWPRFETILLVAALVLTAATKVLVIRGHKPTSLWLAGADVVLPDVVFFSAVLAVIYLAYACWPRDWTARVAVAIAVMVLVWAVLNATWLFATGVQLQPGILHMLAREPLEFLPIVRMHAAKRWPSAVLLALFTLALAAGSVWRLIRPAGFAISQGVYARRAVVALIIVIAASIIDRSLAGQARLGYESQVLGFNSHWHALAATVADPSRYRIPSGQARDLPRAGERRVVPPTSPAEAMPNVVLVLLESVSHAVTSLGQPDRASTPKLQELASHGAEFVLTRVPVSHTTKAFWTVLTGTYPDIHPDYAEAVLVDRPYEGLPSLLRRCGYRSGFFQMSKGTYECAPGLFANLAFDEAWFRENLEDPSAHIGYLGGDDFRMIDPAFEWFDAGPHPTFLMMITCISHDPYEVPDWFERPAEDVYDRYIQTIRYTDRFLDRIDEELARRGLVDRTILCVIGDHGASFRERRRYGRWNPLEEVTRVPWVLRWPGHVEPGLRVTAPCSQLDVTPTLLDLLGFDIAQAGFDGNNALGTIDPQRRLYFSSWFADSPLGYVEGDQKWVWWPYNDVLFEYDLARDPTETSPRAIEGAARDRVTSRLREWQRSSHIVFDAKRFRGRLVFGHWQAFSSGRSAWAYYVP